MGHVEGLSRDQRELVAPSLDEVVGADHAIRVIDAFVDTLDLFELGFKKVVAADTGRPRYHPADLLKLYVYGYSNQMRSSRRLEREAVRNVEVQWLVNRLQPSFKTIADFRKDHADAITAVTRAFVRFCRSASLFGAELVAIDGTKIEAVASRKQVITPKALAKQTAALDAKIAAYLADMDQADREDAAEPAGSAEAVAAALATLRSERAAVQAQAKALADEGLTQRVIGEADARLMKTARHGHQVAYNAQTAVDSQHGLIAAFELTNACNDFRQLLPMAQMAQAVLGEEALTVVADAGYSNGEQGQACEKAGITPAVPRPQTTQTRGLGLFSRDDFSYDAATDTWTCPNGKTLTLFKTCQANQAWNYHTNACADCPLRPQCTKSVTGRTIVRHFFEDDRSAMHQHTVDDPTFMKQRRELVEHPFGTMKWLLGYPRFLVRGIKKARSELALVVLGFNLKRAINILGVQALLAILKPHPA